MKKFHLISLLFMAAFTLVFTSCDELLEDKNTLAGNLKVKNVSAHYVAYAIIVDFQIENRSGKDLNDLQFGSWNNKVTADNGSSSFGLSFSKGEGEPFKNESISNITIAKGETCNMRLKITGNDLVSGVKKVDVAFVGSSKQLGQLEENVLSFSSKVTDSRVPANSIWTNDDKMAYSKPIVSQTGDDLYATFDITNNTGVDLKKVSLTIGNVDNGNGTSFGNNISSYNNFLIIDGNSRRESADITIGKGETREVTLRVPGFFKTRARCVNATIKMESDYYEFAYGAFYLTSVNVD